MTMVEPLLDPHEVAHLLGIDVRTLANWRASKKGPLPYVKVGRRVKYRQADIAEFIEQQTVRRQA